MDYILCVFYLRCEILSLLLPLVHLRAAAPLQNELKIHWFFRHDFVKGLRWFTLQPKSATEISWWLVHWNIEKYNNNFRTCNVFLFPLVFIFLVCRLEEWHVFRNIVFKLGHKLYEYIVCQPPSSTKILGAPILTAMGLKIKIFWDIMLCLR